jgi:hypothetical protein
LAGGRGATRLAAIGAACVALVIPLGSAHGQSGIDLVQQPRGKPIAGLPGVSSITTGVDANLVPTMPGPPTQPWDNTTHAVTAAASVRW